MTQPDRSNIRAALDLAYERGEQWQETPRGWAERMTQESVAKARIGWWVLGGWCPTRKIRDHEMARVQRMFEAMAISHTIPARFPR